MSCVIRLQDTTLAQDPVAGVVVRVYTDAEVFVTEETTDVDGEVDITLDGAAAPGTTYHVRAYKPGCSFGGPWEIAVQDPLPPSEYNDWTMDVNVFEVANSPTPGLCRVSGYLRYPDGRLLQPDKVHFSPFKVPQVFYGAVVAGELTADASTGYVQVDLIRGGEYEVVVPGWLEVSRKVLIPDRGGVLLADLLFPIPALIVWAVASPTTIHIGETVDVTPAVTGSDYADWGMAPEYLDWAVDDDSVVSLTYTSATMSLTGRVVGTTILRATRTDACFSVAPTRDLINEEFTVVVVP